MNQLEKLRLLKRLRRIARLMDGQFGIPFTRFRIGLDGILGLVPGVGDAVTAAVACYIVLKAREMGVSRETQARMLINVLLDFAVGAVPVVGDVADFLFKANKRNIQLLEQELDREVIDIQATRRNQALR